MSKLESSEMPPVYLDHHATTPVDPRVLDAMLPYSTEVFGNPASSVHQFGWREEAVEQARREVATLIGASAREITFTSGATESNNLAIAGLPMWPRPEGGTSSCRRSSTSQCSKAPPGLARPAGP